MTQRKKPEEINGIEALRMILNQEIVYDIFGCSYELVNYDIVQKYKNSRKDYYVVCTMSICTFLKQIFYTQDKK